MTRITINGVSLDPTEPPVGLESALASTDSSSTDYIIVQVAGPLTSVELGALAAAGADVLEYVPENTYICRYPGSSLTAVTALPFVVWAGEYLEGFKIAPELMTPAADPRPRLLSVEGVETSMSQEPRDVEVVLHRDADPEAARARIAEAARMNAGDLEIADGKVFLSVLPQMLARLAAVDEVRHVEEAVVNKLHNTVALGIMRVDQVHSGPQFRGEGQIVAIADTGFDKGSASNVHPAFAGRVDKVIPLGRPTGNDPDGHGTHVAGSVLGDGVSPAMGGPVTGSAPGARLVMQSIMDATGRLGGIPPSLLTLFEQAYAEGARVHTNSWGAPVAGRYTSNSFDVDRYVWEHRDLTILFSAGNEGTDGNANGVIDAGSIGSPGTARNCITVGASESLRPGISKKWGTPWPSDYPRAPIMDDLWADNADGMAAFSSRGPTRDGRIKPDVIAPGTAILSAHSRDASVGSFWGPSTDSAYCFMGGTSMATPLVAGCAALVRQALGGNPSAALVKAMLVNGAVDISGQYAASEAGALPNFAEGFGRVNMANTVGQPEGVSVSWIDEAGALRTGEAWSHQVTLEQPGTLKVTIVWTDPPGEVLQNDLDLIVRAPGGSERHGNVDPASSAFDRTNNVEQVEWRDAPAGDYEIRVVAYRAALHPQDFALVVRVGP